MELKHFFHPVKVKPWSLIPSEDAVVASVSNLHDLKTIDITSFHVAIMGIDESTYSHANQGCRLSPHLIRPYLYGMRRNSRSLKVLELGNLLGKTLNDKYIALIEVIRQLGEANVPTVMIGGSQEFTASAFKGVASYVQNPNLCVIDAMMDDGSGDSDLSSRNFLHTIRQNNTIHTGQLSLLGLQKYLTSVSHDQLIEEYGMNVLRLGELRGNDIQQSEPFLRDAHLVSFDASSIKHADMPGQTMPMPNGLSSFQACQMAWYAGVSDHLKAFGLFEVNPETDVTGASVILGAQIIWHVMEGIAHRYNDYPVRDIESYLTFHVCHDELMDGIRFFCNPENQRWWVELNSESDKKIISCSEVDYQSFKFGDIHDRWWKLLQRKSSISNQE
jgi:arginase family enzyme